MASIEIVWEKILSREAGQITAAFFELDDESRRQVLAHLRVMVSEEGWHPEQKVSAQTALDALKGAGKE